MAIRIVAVLVLLGLGGLVVYNQQRAKKETPVQTENKPAPYAHCKEMGVKPDGEPEFNVGVELQHKGQRNVLEFTVTEVHGWCVDHIYIDFWYEEKDENGDWKMLGSPVTFLMKGYIGFGETLQDNTTLLDYEMPEVPSHFGTTENWRARVSQHGDVTAPGS